MKKLQVTREYWEQLKMVAYPNTIRQAESIEDLKQLLIQARKEKVEHIFLGVLKRNYPIYYEVLEKFIALI